jgi:sec-independent protein translocase protein TatA
MNLGLPELLLIGGVVLLVFGPKRLPELAKGMGKGIRDFKKALEGGGDSEKIPPTTTTHTQEPTGQNT